MEVLTEKQYIKLCGGKKAFRKSLEAECKKIWEEAEKKNVVIRARKKSWMAQKSGRLKRPKVCSKCGGEGEIQGHHEDYSKPLDVIFLCRDCHAARHRELRNNF